MRRACSSRSARPSPAAGPSLPLGSSGADDQQKLADIAAQDRGHAGQDRPPQGHRARPDARTSRAGPARIRRLQGRIGTLQQRQSVVQSSSTGQGPSSSARRPTCASSAPGRCGCARASRGAADPRRAARRALPGRRARPRDRDPQLQGLRRAARARRVPAPHQRAGPADHHARARREGRRDARTRCGSAKLEARAARRRRADRSERRNEIAAVKQDLIDTRVGYDATRAGKQRALIERARRAPPARGRALADEGDAGAGSRAILNPRARRHAPRRPDPRRLGRDDLAGQRRRSPRRSASRARGRPATRASTSASPTGTPIRAADGGRVAIAGLDRRLRQLHLHPAHRVAVHLLRPPVEHRRRASASRSARARSSAPSGCTGHCFGAAPALRGADQRRRHEPDELPLARGRRAGRPPARLSDRAARDRRPRPSAEDVRADVRARLPRLGRGDRCARTARDRQARSTGPTR